MYLKLNSETDILQVDLYSFGPLLFIPINLSRDSDVFNVAKVITLLSLTIPIRILIQARPYAVFLC